MTFAPPLLGPGVPPGTGGNDLGQLTYADPVTPFQSSPLTSMMQNWLFGDRPNDNDPLPPGMRYTTNSPHFGIIGDMMQRRGFQLAPDSRQSTHVQDLRPFNGWGLATGRTTREPPPELTQGERDFLNQLREILDE
jgi:hypothetical protein